MLVNKYSHVGGTSRQQQVVVSLNAAPGSAYASASVAANMSNGGNLKERHADSYESERERGKARVTRKEIFQVGMSLSSVRAALLEPIWDAIVSIERKSQFLCLQTNFIGKRK